VRKYELLVIAAVVSLCVLGSVTLGIASSLLQYHTVNQALSVAGGTLLIAAMTLLLIAGWKGVLTLTGGLIGGSCLIAGAFCLAQCAL
jgi:hypothetical protein